MAAATLRVSLRSGLCIWSAAQVSGFSAGPYVFTFAVPAPAGSAELRFAPGHGIHDLGTPAELSEAILAGGSWIHPDAHVHPDAVIGDRVVVEYEAVVESGATLSNCVVLPGAMVASGEVLDRTLRNPAGDLPW